MNWKFILRWVITFTVCLIVYNLTASFWMSLGILILLIVAENLIVDWWKKRKEGFS
jgi:Na+-translocating ferredoxin:NAD+ oxidoreductase RnfE subunit